MAIRSAESTPSVKSAGVVSAFATPMRPLASSISATSVKVPPISTPIRQAMPAPSLLPAKCRQVLPAPATTGRRASARHAGDRGGRRRRYTHGFFAAARVHLTETLRQIARLDGAFERVLFVRAPGIALGRHDQGPLHCLPVARRAAPAFSAAPGYTHASAFADQTRPEPAGERPCALARRGELTSSWRRCRGRRGRLA